MKKGTIILLICIVIFIGFVASVIGSIVGSYNEMIISQEEVSKSWGDLQASLQRRGDLIPNLVSIVKGTMKHESDIIDKVTSARANLVNANTVEEKALANSELSSSLKMLMLNITENYPEIAATNNFQTLTDELSGTENRIAVDRRDYNAVVKSYNLLIKKFPNNILASMFGFKQEAYFEADEASAGVPNVSFE